MKIGVLFSGGKDSVMALYWAAQNHTPEVLISMKSERDDSYMFHIPNIDLVPVQAEALNMSLIFEKTSGVKEKELLDLERAVKKAKEDYQIEGIVAGALASEYQKSRVEKICEKFDLKCFSPFWKKDPEEYMDELISAGFEVIITGAAAEGIDKNWLGRKIDKQLLEELKELNEKCGVHIAGEGGEYETFVLDGPVFEKKIKIEKSEIKWKGNSGELLIKEMSFKDKIQ
ncbi:MAG: TIGR00289 family protein [Candidatus Undinarchaeales archaeon]